MADEETPTENPTETKTENATTENVEENADVDGQTAAPEQAAEIAAPEQAAETAEQPSETDQEKEPATEAAEASTAQLEDGEQAPAKSPTKEGLDEVDGPIGEEATTATGTEGPNGETEAPGAAAPTENGLDDVDGPPETVIEDSEAPVAQTEDPATEAEVPAGTPVAAETPVPAETEDPGQAEVPVEAEVSAVDGTETVEVDIPTATVDETQTVEASADGEQNEQGETEVAVPSESSGPAKPVPPTTPEPNKDTVGTETEPMEDQPETDPHAASPPPKVDSTINLEATVTVKFVLLPCGQVATLACTLGRTLKQLKEHFSNELKMSASLILLMFDGQDLSDDTTLADLGVVANGTVQLEMQSADPVNAPIRAFRPRQEYHMPDVITVRAPNQDGKEVRDIVVEIERARRNKPYMGGYRHKKTGVEFHHASAQTMPKTRVVSDVERFCRDTQTTQQRHMRQQTTEDTSTQMTKIGVYVANLTDRLLVPGKYTTAEAYHKMILEKVIIIQKYYRRWLAGGIVDNIRQDQQSRLEWERKEELRKKKKVPTATLR